MTIRKSATDNGFIIFKDQLSLLKLIPDEQLGKAIKLLLENFDELPEKDDIAYEMFATNVRRYRETSEKARQFGLMGGNPTLKGVDKDTLKLQEKKKQNNNIKENINIKENGCIGKPSIEEVKQYCVERNNGVDYNKWYNYYSSNGWKVGRNPMKDWKAAVRTWERQGNESQEKEQEPMIAIEQNKFYIDDSETYCKGYDDLVKQLDDNAREMLWKWFMSKFEGKKLKLSFVRSVLTKAIQSNCVQS